jgi:hypothetical protein
MRSAVALSLKGENAEETEGRPSTTFHSAQGLKVNAPWISRGVLIDAISLRFGFPFEQKPDLMGWVLHGACVLPPAHEYRCGPG